MSEHTKEAKLEKLRKELNIEVLPEEDPIKRGKLEPLGELVQNQQAQEPQQVLVKRVV